MSARSVLLFSLLTCLTGCGPLFFIEAEADEICKTVPEFVVPAMPGSGTVSLDTATDIDLSEQLALLPVEDLDADLELLTLTLTPTRGVTDLSFVEKAQASTLDGEREVPVVSYVRAEGAAAAPSVELGGAGRQDLFPYLQKGKMTLKATLTAVFPQQEWAVQARGCFHVRTRVDYATALKGMQGAQ
jgi:hypothetical protein